MSNARIYRTYKFDALILNAEGMRYIVNINDEILSLEEWNKIKFEIDKFYYEGGRWKKMSNKKYYWLKLNDNFFEDDTIVWLEEQDNGKDYVIFYLKLLLKSLKEEGTLVRYVGERLMPYDTNSLAKLTNTPVDTVRVAMQLFIEFGLVKQMDAGELYLTQIDEMIGTETDSARRVRKHRAIKNANEEVKMLHCNERVTKK